MQYLIMKMIIGVSLSLPKATGAKGSENATPHMKIIIDVSRREATGATGAERATPLRLKVCPRYVLRLKKLCTQMS